MARPNREIEQQMEQVEADLARLVTVLVLLDLMITRMVSVAGATGAQRMVSPAIDDAERARSLIRSTQQSISRRLPAR